jgi:ubiquinone/menaquinone biosynthesis C-methylase UbiE
MTNRSGKVCPVELSGGLDSRLRRLLQNPQHLLAPHVHEGMTVLDFGCGPGFFTLELARLVGSSGRVVAADLQEGMLDKLRTKVRGSELESRIEVHRCKPDHIGIPPPIDFVLAFYVLHELPDTAAFFSEVSQLLSIRGKVLVVEPPFHVSKASFESSLVKAESAGLAVVERPRVPFNKAAVLQLDMKPSLVSAT